MKKKYTLIIDTETSMNQHVIDFAAVLVDNKGNVKTQCAVLVSDFFRKEELFYNRDIGVFGRKNLNKRMKAYENMLKTDVRLLRSAKSIQNWLDMLNEHYQPSITAYNLRFDMDMCENSGIVLPKQKTFCLWQESCQLFAKRRGYVAFCLNNNLLTPALNFSTSAETMFKYLSGNVDYIEPHTALEDILTCELHIFNAMKRQKKAIKSIPYNWRNHRLRDAIVIV